jgi:hypothetical protein
MLFGFVLETLVFNILSCLVYSLQVLWHLKHLIWALLQFLFHLFTWFKFILWVVNVLLRVFVYTLTDHNTPQICKCSITTLGFSFINVLVFSLLCILKCIIQKKILYVVHIIVCSVQEICFVCNQVVFGKFLKYVVWLNWYLAQARK